MNQLFDPNSLKVDAGEGGIDRSTETHDPGEQLSCSVRQWRAVDWPESVEARKQGGNSALHGRERP